MADFEITGKVIDQVQGGEAVPFATVVPIGADGKVIANLGAITDMDGNFKLKIPIILIPNISGVPMPLPVANKIRVSFVGMETKFVPLKFSQKYYKVDIGMKNQVLQEVTVTAEHPRTTCKKQGGVYNEGTKICVTTFPKKECVQRGGTYDDRLQKCMMPPPFKKKNRTALYVGIGLVATALLFAVIYKVSKNRG